jgi:hypothetical protein
MSPKASSLLKLLPGRTDLSPSEAPAVDERSGSTPIPTAGAMAVWRAQADARLESDLAHFDMQIIAGQDPARSAHTLCHGFMEWARDSVAVFKLRPVTDAQRAEWSRERAVWVGLADLAAQDASVDPSSVDRFLQIWLGVLHEASATGRSWLFAR